MSCDSWPTFYIGLLTFNLQEICIGFNADLQQICLRFCLRFAWDLQEICMRFAWDFYEIFMRFLWDLLEICMRFAWDLHKICKKYVWDMFHIYAKFHLLWHGEWVNDRPGSRDAYASKKNEKLIIVFRISTCKELSKIVKYSKWDRS